MNRKTLPGWIAGITFMLLLSPYLQAQQSAQTVVTIVSKAKHEIVQKVTEEALQVSSDSKPAAITGWNWAGNTRLQLMVLLDDSTSGSFGRQLEDLKSFILTLPPTTEVSVAYMQNGKASATQKFTLDHQAAAKAVRLPMGTPGGNGSPYFVISDIAKKWPSSEPAVRREVLMITDGTDPYSGRRFDPNDPYYQAAIQDAQKAGLIIYSIFYRGAGWMDRGEWATDTGQNYLVGISQATGGHCYLEGLSNPVSLAPFLYDLHQRLQNQYELSFVNPRESAKETLANLKVKIQGSGLEVEAPAKAPVKQLSSPGF